MVIEWKQEKKKNVQAIESESSRFLELHANGRIDVW